MGGSSSAGGPGTPTRAGHGVVPGVVISPSSGNAPVRLEAHDVAEQGLTLCSHHYQETYYCC